MFSKCDRREETGFCHRLSVIRRAPGWRASGTAGMPQDAARGPEQ